MKKNKFTHYGFYPLLGFKVPIYYNESDENIEGRNWVYEQLLTLAVWIDFEFSEGFGYYIGERIKND